MVKLAQGSYQEAREPNVEPGEGVRFYKGEII